MTTNDLSNWTTVALVDKLVSANDELIARAAYPPATSPPSWASKVSRSCARSRSQMIAPRLRARWKEPDSAVQRLIYWFGPPQLSTVAGRLYCCQ
jgi:hypothetical protein